MLDTCLSCICEKCATLWSGCLADDGCKKAVGCVIAGCTLSQCASLTSGEESLSRAEIVEDCRSNKNKCRTECVANSGGSPGTGGQGGAPGGTGGASAGAGQNQGGAASPGSGGAGGDGGQGGAVGKTCTPGCNPSQICDPNTGNCEQCITDQQCTQNPYGYTCQGISGTTPLSCGCSDNFDCSTHPGGAFCEPFSSVCSCRGEQDCLGSSQGKICVELDDPDRGKINQCGCTDDSQCNPGDTCLFSLCAH
jgi:hypothetical protein